MPATPAKATLLASRAPAAFFPGVGGATTAGALEVGLAQEEVGMVLLLAMEVTVTLERVMVLVTLSVKVQVVVMVAGAELVTALSARARAGRAARTMLEKRILKCVVCCLVLVRSV